MKPNSPEPQAPESYATFWEPIAVDVPAPTDHPAPTPCADPCANPAKDAYLEFVNVTEDAPVPPRAERV